MTGWLINWLTFSTQHIQWKLWFSHDRFGSSFDLNLNAHLHYPNDIDRSLIRMSLTRSESIDLTIIITPITLLHLYLLFLVRLGGYIVNCATFIRTGSSGNCEDVFYHIVSFLIPNPQHTVSLHTFIYQESAWSGRSGLAISRTQRNILRYSSSGITDTGIVSDTGVICHDSPWHVPLSRDVRPR